MHKTNINDLFEALFKLFSAVIAAAFGYFTPIKGFVHLLLVLLFLDMLIGWWANNKIKGERFLWSKVWGTTVPRMILGTVLISVTFMWDTTYSQNAVETYRIAGWMLSGFIIASILVNGYKITKWGPLKYISNEILKKVITKNNDEDIN